MGYKRQGNHTDVFSWKDRGCLLATLPSRSVLDEIEKVAIEQQSSSNAFRINSRSTLLVYIQHAWWIRNTFKMLVGNSEGKRSTVRPKHIRQDNIKRGLRETG
jgi:hypothetical protein